MTRIALCLLLALAALPAPPLRAQETLRWQWRAGDTHTVRSSLEIRTSSERVGRAPQRSQELQTWTLEASVTEVDADGTATVGWTIARIELAVRGRQGTFHWDSAEPDEPPRGSAALSGRILEPMVGGRLTTVLDSRGGMLGLEGVDALVAAVTADAEPGLARILEGTARATLAEASVRNLLLGNVRPFPEAPVSVGESWTADVRLMSRSGPGLPTAEQSSTLDGVDVASGERVAGLRMETDSEIPLIGRDDALFGPPRAEAEAAGSADFSLERGLVLESSGERFVTMHLNLPPPAFHVRSVIHEVSRYERIDPADGSGGAPRLVAEVPPGSAVVEERTHPGGVTEWVLANGVRVLLKPERFEEPRVVLLGMGPGGASLASEEDVASARAAARLVAEGGAGRLTPLQTRSALADTRVSVQPQLAEWGQGIRGMASSSGLEPLLQLVYLYATEPRADPFVLDSWVRDGELELRTAPPTAAGSFDEAWVELLGVDLPFIGTRTLETVAGVDLERAVSFYRERFADAGGMVFNVVGTFDPDELRPLVERYLGALPSTGRAGSWRDSGWRHPEGVVDETVHSSVVSGSNTRVSFHGPIDLASPAERVRVEALGAALEIRLRRALRERLGEGHYVSVRTGTAGEPYAYYGIGVSFSSEPDQADDVVAAVLEQVDALQEAGPSAEEADRARARLRETHERNLASDTWWSNELARAAFEPGPPTERIVGVAPEIDRVDAELVRQAARSYLSRERYVRLTVSPDPGAGGEDRGWLPPRELQRRADLESDRGYYPIRLEGRPTDLGYELRAAFARFPTNSRAEWRWGVRDEAFARDHDRLTADGFTRIWHQSFTDASGVVLNQGVWMRLATP